MGQQEEYKQDLLSKLRSYDVEIREKDREKYSIKELEKMLDDAVRRMSQNG